jgi:hypothetical protein
VSLSEEIVQRGFGPLHFGRVFGNVSAGFRFEEVAEICLVFFPYLLGNWLPAMFGLGRVVLDAQLADVQLGIAGLANIEPPKGQAKAGE